MSDARNRHTAAESLTSECTVTRICKGACGRSLPLTAEHYDRTGTYYADGRPHWRGECRECRRTYDRRVKRRAALLARHGRQGAEVSALLAIKDVGTFAERMVSLCRELESEGCSLASWIEMAVDDRRTGRKQARNVTAQSLELLLRAYLVTEDYLLLLAGEEPQPDGELSSLLAGRENVAD